MARLAYVLALGLALPVALLISCTSGSSVEVRPPEGYEALDESSYPGLWRDHEGTEALPPTPDRARGDYDGDGLEDAARIWRREPGPGWVATAYLSSRPQAPIRLAGSEQPLTRRVIRTVEAGAHRTHAFYGIGPGGPDTTAVVHLTHDAVNLGRLESEGETFVWNAAKGQFDRIAMY